MTTIDAKLACVYVGLQFERLAEKLQSMATFAPTGMHSQGLADMANEFSNAPDYILEAVSRAAVIKPEAWRDTGAIATPAEAKPVALPVLTDKIQIQFTQMHAAENPQVAQMIVTISPYPAVLGDELAAFIQREVEGFFRAKSIVIPQVAPVGLMQ